MKAILKSTVVLASLMAFGQAQADVVLSGKKLEGSVDFMMEKFSADNQTRLYCDYTEEMDNGVRTTFNILDENFNIVKTFHSPIYRTVTSTYSIARVMDGPLNVYVENSYEYSWVEGITKDAFIEMSNQQGATRQENHNGELWCMSDDLSRYYYSEIYGYNYPNYVYVWKDGASFERHFSYSYQDWGQTGVFGEARQETDSRTPWPSALYPKDSSCSDLNDITLTQTLFNNDDKYEWLVPVYEAVDCSYTNSYEKVEGSRVRCVGYKVESETGATITEFKMPAGYWADGYSPDLFMMGDKNYLLIDVTDYSKDTYIAVFEINPQNASVKMVGAPMKARVHPTLPRRGMTINVDLSTPAAEGCKVIITSVNGKTVMTQPLEAGSMGTTIDTDRFEKGMYIVTVSDGKTTKEHTKIIIR